MMMNKLTAELAAKSNLTVKESDVCCVKCECRVTSLYSDELTGHTWSLCSVHGLEMGVFVGVKKVIHDNG